MSNRSNLLRAAKHQNLPLESARQVTFDWLIAGGKLRFGSKFDSNSDFGDVPSDIAARCNSYGTLSESASAPSEQEAQAICSRRADTDKTDYLAPSLVELFKGMANPPPFAIQSPEYRTQQNQMEIASLESEHTKNEMLSTAFNHLIVVVSHDGRIITFNQAAEQVFDLCNNVMPGKKLADIIDLPVALGSPQRSMDHVATTATEGDLINRPMALSAISADGSRFPVELGVVPIHVNGAPVFAILIRDISERNRSQIALQQSALRYQQLVELSPEAILVHQRDRLLLLNQAAARILGAANASELVGRNIFDFIHPTHHMCTHQHMQSEASPSIFIEQLWVRKDGTKFHTEVAASRLVYNGEHAIQVVVRDITVRKRTEILLAGQNRILNMVATGVPLSDILREIALFVEAQSNRGLCSILLLDSEGLILSNGASPNLPDNYVSEMDGLLVAPASGSCGTAAFRMEPVIVADIANDPLWDAYRNVALRHGLNACTSWPIIGKKKNVLGTMALYFRENATPSEMDRQMFEICASLAGIAIESRASEEKIRRLAHYDGLTSLPNRFLFKEYLDLALCNAQRHSKKFAVFFLDLDKFKDINDTYGHEAGDQVLKIVAKRLRGSLRKTDKIARMGGDEFYVLIEDLDDGRYAAEIAQKLLEAAARPVQISHSQYQLSVSIGIAVYPNDGCNAQTLLMNADNAMYRAKNRGKNTYEFFLSTDRIHV